MGETTNRRAEGACATDADLLERLATGRSEAFTALWGRHSERINRICLKIMGDRDEAADAFGMVALLAWQKLPEHARVIADAEAWLMRMTRNVCIDIHRRRTRRAQNMAPLDDVDADDFPDRGMVGPEEMAIGAEMLKRVASAIGDLPKWARPAAQMFFVEDMEYEGIAVRLGISRAYVRKCVEVGRKGLQQRMQISPPPARGPKPRESGGLAPTLSLDEGGGDK